MTDTLAPPQKNGKVDVVVKREPLVYEEASPHSLFYDQLNALRGKSDAIRRLEDHERQMAVEQRVNPNTTAGTGGEFAPPLWLIQNFKTPIRGGRPLGDLVQNMVLPPGVAQVNIPKSITNNVLGTDTAIQPAQGQADASYDETSTALTSTAVTIAGELDVSQQLLDLTPAPGFDAIAYLTLSRDYNVRLEGQLVNGTGTNGQVTGLINFAAPASNQVSGASVPTTMTGAYQLWELMGQCFANIGNNRGLGPEAWLMSPRRWAWIASNVDSQNRPLMTPGDTAPRAGNLMDKVGAGQNDPNSTSVSQAYGPVMGLPAYLDAQCLPNGATGTDTVFCLRPSDMWLFESTPKFAVVTNANSGTLQVKLQLRRYVAFLGFVFPAGLGWVNAIPQPSNF